MRSPPHTMNCKAYLKVSCWLPRQPGKEFCATCASAKSRTELREFVSSIQTKREDEIYDFYQTHKDALNSLTNSPLDTFLYAVWAKSKQLFERILLDIRSTCGGPMNATLLLRVRNHTRTSLCPVYSYMLRKDLFPDMILPEGCLTCLAHTIHYGDEEKHRFVKRMIVYEMKLPALVRNTVAMLEGAQRILEFQRALIEKEFRQSQIDIFLRMCGTPNHLLLLNARQAHPLAWTWGSVAKQVLKDRMAPWKEELIAKSWHPSRMLHWCLDLEEQGLWRADMVDFPDPRPLCCSTAEWNFRWD